MYDTRSRERNAPLGHANVELVVLCPTNSYLAWQTRQRATWHASVRLVP